MRGGVFSPHTPGIWVTEIPNRFFPMNGISEVVDLSRHDWNYLAKIISKDLSLL
jgi:hypothetical protein